MSVISSNPFALLGDAEEPAPVAAPATTQQQASKPRQNKVVPGANKGGKFLKDSSKPAASDNTPFEQAPDHKGERGPSRSGRGGRGRGRGGRRGRDFDRHSGAGLKEGEKKEVAGHSWGDPVASALDEEGNPVAAPVDEAAAATEEWAAGAESAEPVEPEPEYKTLDQFLSASAAAKKAAEARRKANEGVDDSQWKGTTLLKKDEELDSWFAGLAVNGKSSGKKNKERPTKTTLEIEQTFAAPARGDRGGRGGRGRGDRGSRGGRGGRGGSRGGQRIDVADTSAFPSLGA